MAPRRVDERGGQGRPVIPPRLPSGKAQVTSASPTGQNMAVVRPVLAWARSGAGLMQAGRQMRRQGCDPGAVKAAPARYTGCSVQWRPHDPQDHSGYGSRHRRRHGHSLCRGAPAIELLAITTVFGNATIENGTHNALWLKQKYGMQADVAQGAATPCGRPRGPHHCGARPHRLWRRAGRGGDPQPGSPSGLAIHRRDGEGPPRRDHPGDHGAADQSGAGARGGPEVAALVEAGGGDGRRLRRQRSSRQREPLCRGQYPRRSEAADRVFTADWPVVIIGLDVTQQSFFSSAYLDALRDQAGSRAASCGT